MKTPRAESIHECGVGKVPPGARKLLKKMRSRRLRRFANQIRDITRPKAIHCGWYW